jgi:hypothetical protein
VRNYRAASAGDISLDTEFGTANEQGFNNRVRMALTHLVMEVATEPEDTADHAGRAAFASKLIENNEAYVPRACYLLSAMGLTPASPDQEILGALGQMVTAMAKVAP